MCDRTGIAGVVRLDLKTLGWHFFEDPEEDRALVETALADVVPLARVAGMVATLEVMDGGESVCIAVFDPQGSASSASRIGRRAPLPNGTSGRVLTAGMARNERDSFLEKMDAELFAQVGFSDRRAFARHLDLIAARGYATDVGVLPSAPRSIAAPILGRNAYALAAVALHGAAGRIALHDLAALLVEATRRASARAGGVLRPQSKAPPPADAPSPRVRVLADTHNLIGESPVYDAASDSVFWVDMYEPAIFRLDRGSRRLARFASTEMVTALGVTPSGLLTATPAGVWLIDPETGDRSRFMGHPEPHLPTNRPNDGKCDSHGRFWLNTIDLGFAAGAGALYRLDPDGAFRTTDTGLDLPNGIGWSPDNRTMYLADTARRSIYAYDFSERSGELSNRRTLVQIPADSSGAPDGLAVDANGDLWVAMFDGWRVSRYSSAGALLEEIVMPVPRPTSCALGPDRTLLVTSARIRISEATLEIAPHAGALFEIAL